MGQEKLKNPKTEKAVYQAKRMIEEFFREYTDYDYNLKDINRHFRLQGKRDFTLQVTASAIEKLEKEGLVRAYRKSNGNVMYQLTTWREKTEWELGHECQLSPSRSSQVVQQQTP